MSDELYEFYVWLKGPGWESARDVLDYFERVHPDLVERYKAGENPVAKAFQAGIDSFKGSESVPSGGSDVPVDPVSDAAVQEVQAAATGR